MERRNFFSVCAGVGLTLLGLKAAKSCVCGTEKLEDFIFPPESAQITFYGDFIEEHLRGNPLYRKIIPGELTELLVFVDDKGCCTFNPNNRHIGYVKAVDDNGILVTLANGFSNNRLYKIKG